MELHPLQTARLWLEPLAMETARAILAGDLSGLTAAGLAAALGTHGPVDEAGCLEIGYGLAAHADLQRGQPPGAREVGLPLPGP